MFCLDAKTINKQKKCKFIFVYLFIILCFTVLLLAVKASGTSYRVELRVLGLLGGVSLLRFFVVINVLRKNLLRLRRFLCCLCLLSATDSFYCMDLA